MPKAFKIWLSIEEIDEENENNGNDLDTFCLNKFGNYEEAVDYFQGIKESNRDPLSEIRNRRKKILTDLLERDGVTLSDFTAMRERFEVAMEHNKEFTSGNLSIELEQLALKLWIEEDLPSSYKEYLIQSWVKPL